MNLAELLTSQGMDPKTHPWAAVARPAVRFEQAVGEGDPVGSLGGLPALPEGVAWPRWNWWLRGGRKGQKRAEATARAGRGFPLAFVAQLECSALADTGLPFPATGRLLFFYECQEQPWGFRPSDRGGFVVMYVPSDVEGVPQSPPADLDEEYVFERVALQARTVLSFPESRPEGDGEAYLDDDPEMSAYVVDPFAETPIHQSGGYAGAIQGDDMELQCALITMGEDLGSGYTFGPEVGAKAEKAAHQWKLVFQLSSDEAMGAFWGDMGRLYFWMREDDIREGRWDQAWMHLQCG